MSSKKNDMIIGCLCALGCEILYGMSFAFSKRATEVARPLALLGWRFLAAAAVMSVCVAAGIVKIRRRAHGDGARPDGGRAPIAPLLGVALLFPVIYFIGETFGIARTTASESGVIIACVPAACMAASTLILHKKPTRIQVLGIVVTFIGVLVTVLSVGTSASLSVGGYLLLMMAVISYALYTVRVERARAYTSAEITYVMLLAGAAVFVVLAIADAAASGTIREFARLPFAEPAFFAAVIYQGIGCSILAFFMSNVALAKIGVNRTASFVGVTTVVSILAGALVLNEPFTFLQGIGAAVIIAGVYIANAG